MTDFSLEWRGREIQGAVHRAAKKALLEVGADLQQRSSDQAPVDTGDLRGNASVDRNNLDNLQIFVGYSLPYALRQHEEINYSHPMGGKAKFLEDPFREQRINYQMHLAKAVGQATKAGA